MDKYSLHATLGARGTPLLSPTMSTYAPADESSTDLRMDKYTLDGYILGGMAYGSSAAHT